MTSRSVTKQRVNVLFRKLKRGGHNSFASISLRRRLVRQRAIFLFNSIERDEPTGRLGTMNRDFDLITPVLVSSDDVHGVFFVKKEILP